MDLRQTESIWLYTRTPRELIALIRYQSEWDDAAVRNLDGALTAMVGTALARSAPDLDELEDYQSLLRSARQRLPDACKARERYVTRWESFSDCLRIRAELMVHGSYQAFSHMRHVCEIVEALARAGENGLTQDDLRNQRGLQPARLGQNAPEIALHTQKTRSGINLWGKAAWVEDSALETVKGDDVGTQLEDFNRME